MHGYFIDVVYNLMDQYANPMRIAGIKPGENVAGTGWNDNFSTPPSTRSGGSFDDVPFGACFGFTSHYCGLQTSRDFRATTANGVVHPISTNTIQKYCNDGILLIIQGNYSIPTNQNKTYNLGNTQ
jgi:hypothetical protein